MAPPYRLVLTTLHRDVRDIGPATPSDGLGGLASRAARVEREIGGVQVQTEALRAAFEARDHESVLLTPFDGGAFAPAVMTAITHLLKPLAPHTAERWRVWWHVMLLRRSIRRSQRLLDGSEPTVVVAQCALAALEAARASHESVPIVIVAH